MSDGTQLATQVTEAPHPVVTVVFAHGWSMDHRLWRHVIARLADHQTPVRLVTFDGRGHGLSDAVPAGNATVEQYADDIALMAEQFSVGPKSVVLVGHSLGGMALTTLAGRHPGIFADTVGGAAFLDCTCGPVPRSMSAFAGLARITVPTVLRIGARTPWLTRQFVRFTMFGAAPDPAEVTLSIDQMMSANRHNLADLIASAGGKDFSQQVAQYAAVPVLVIGGSRDRVTPARIWLRRLAAAIDGARLVIVRSAGHQVPQERPDELVAELARLIDEVAHRASPAIPPLRPQT